MKRFIPLISIVLTSCTTSQLPKDSFTCKGVKEQKIRTSGNMNGYSNSELREGRTHNARYYRIVINNGNIHIMTKYAYDCQTVDDGQNTMFYIWRSENLDKFYNTLSDLLEGDGISIPINNDIILTYRYNTLTCNTIVLRNEFLIFITKSEVEKYVKDYPDVKIV